MTGSRKMWIALGILALLSPLGLLAEGTAWGEWGAEEIGEAVGFVPAGMSKAASWWHAVLPDYAVPGIGESALAGTVGYYLSALVGAGFIYLAMMGYQRLLVSGKGQR